jgi:predicted dehydrogenase
MHGNIPAVDDIRELLALDPELVVVATEPATHAHVARAALQAGCAVFVEKPVTTNVVDIDSLEALARSVQRPLLGSALWSWDPIVDALARLVADGQIGRVLRIEGARQNLGCLKPGHDVIDDLLPHDLQILRRIMGQAPHRLQAWGSRLAGTDALDTATVRLEWADGPEAELRLSWVAPEKVRRMTVVGTEGMAVLSPLDTATPLRVLRATPADAARPEPATVQDIWLPPIDGDRTEPLLAQCEETLRCVRGAVPRLPIQAHRDVAAALEAARRSVSRQGQLVEIDSPMGLDSPRATARSRAATGAAHRNRLSSAPHRNPND